MKKTAFIPAFAVVLLLLTAGGCAVETYTCGDYEYCLLEGGTAVITKYTGNDYILVVPDELNGCCVTAVGDKTFYGNMSLSAVILPESVTQIGNEAFSFCSSLTDITLPDSLKQIESNFFFYCEHLKSFHVSADHPTLEVIDGVLFSKAEKRLICYPNGKTGAVYRVPDGTQSIGESAFFRCSKLLEVYLPDGVTVLENHAFELCVGLKTITVPEGVTSLGDFVFQECRALISVTLPDTLTAIGANPFTGCLRLEKIIAAPDHPTLQVCDGVLFFKPEDRLVFYPKTKTDLSYSVPDGTRIIDADAFFNNFSLTSVTLPDSLTVIGDSAFGFCGRMRSINLPDRMTTIGRGAFLACQSLEEITVPEGVTSIEENTFMGCKKLSSVTLPDSVVYVADSAFSECGSLCFVVGQGSWAEVYCKENGFDYTYTPVDPVN